MTERLVEIGATVAVGDISEKALATISRSFNDATVFPIKIDAVDARSIAGGVAEVVNHLGRLDTLVNAAGVVESTSFLDIPEDEWDWIINVNLKGVFLSCQAALPHLLNSGRGRIVNVSAGSGKRGGARLAHYAASKFGVLGITQSIAVEYGCYGLTANAVCPTLVPDTPMGQKILASDQDDTPSAALLRRLEQIPFRRFATADDVADAIMFFISDNAGYINGESLNVDGGVLIG